jgi:hypothetical protein
VKWDILLGVLIFYSVIVIPLRVGFSILLSADEELSDTLIDVMFGADILVSFVTALPDADSDEGGLVTRKGVIAREVREGAGEEERREGAKRGSEEMERGEGAKRRSEEMERGEGARRRSEEKERREGARTRSEEASSKRRREEASRHLPPPSPFF